MATIRMADCTQSTEGEEGQDVRWSSEGALVPLTDRNQVFTWVIYLFAPEGERFKSTQSQKSRLHAVLLDTQVTGRNWISYRLITELGMESQVNRDSEPPNLSDFKGVQIESKGTIAFQWMLHDGGTVHSPVTFHVFDTPTRLDMIFGAPYIVEKRLLSSNRERFFPLVEHNEIKLCKRVKIWSADFHD